MRFQGAKLSQAGATSCVQLLPTRHAFESRIKGDDRTDLVRGYLGSLGCLSVLGRWKMTLSLVFLCFFHVPFFVAFKAFWAFDELSLPARYCYITYFVPLR